METHADGLSGANLRISVRRGLASRWLQRLGHFVNTDSVMYQSPASVASAIEDMADVIVTKAAQKAKEVIESAHQSASQ